MKTIAIIGGGAAGMIAAYSASLNSTGNSSGNNTGNNTEVHLFEKNDKCGKKLMITGKGRCNITNMGDMDSYIENIPHNGMFLYSALSQFNNYDMISLMNENGLLTKVERGLRVFPESDKAADVVSFFANMLENRVRIHYGRILEKIELTDEKITLLFEDGSRFAADAAVLATGGLSYPQTGSTGDGHKIAKDVGHTVTKLYPSLAPFNTKEGFVKELSGLTLKNVAVTIVNSGGEVVYTDFGELLFTHFGVSGPVILSGSARIAERLGIERYRLIIDLKPALNADMLDKRILKDFEKYKNKNIVNALCDLLPKSIIPIVIAMAGVEPLKKVHDMTRPERQALCKGIKAFTLTITGSDGFGHAVITRGGVKINEINPRTMESKKVKNLYFAGELIDVDAYTGGYNLQIAFSTGYLAGKSAAAITGKSYTNINDIEKEQMKAEDLNDDNKRRDNYRKK